MHTAVLKLDTKILSGSVMCLLMEVTEHLTLPTSAHRLAGSSTALQVSFCINLNGDS